jgi:hypothetical protein
MAHKVFICHASNDKQVADAACAALEAQRIPCWIAPRSILAGEEYGKAIVDALGACEIVLLIFSGHANHSPHVRREIERAVSKGKIIVPFRIEDVLPSDAMEFAIGNTHWLDALTPPLERYLSELCTTISRLIPTQALSMELVDGSSRRTVVADRFPFVIGRSSECDLALPQSYVSRSHATITHDDAQFVLEDTQSRHGTFVNGEQVTRRTLRRGDSVQFGSRDAPQLRLVAEDTKATTGTNILSQLQGISAQHSDLKSCAGFWRPPGSSTARDRWTGCWRRCWRPRWR